MDPYIAELLRDIHRSLDRLERRVHRTRRSTHVESKSHRVKKLDLYSITVATPEETITAVKEEQGPIWDEELIQELPLHEEEYLFHNDYQHDEPKIELIGGPRFDPEYEDQQAIEEDDAKTKTFEIEFDIIPSMILPTEPQNEPTLIRKIIPTIVKAPLPPRENDRVVQLAPAQGPAGLIFRPIFGPDGEPIKAPPCGIMGPHLRPPPWPPPPTERAPLGAEIGAIQGLNCGDPWDPQNWPLLGSGMH